jgi:hypothetical protein
MSAKIMNTGNNFLEKRNYTSFIEEFKTLHKEKILTIQYKHEKDDVYTIIIKFSSTLESALRPNNGGYHSSGTMIKALNNHGFTSSGDILTYKRQGVVGQYFTKSSISFIGQVNTKKTKDAYKVPKTRSQNSYESKSNYESENEPKTGSYYYDPVLDSFSDSKSNPKSNPKSDFKLDSKLDSFLDSKSDSKSDSKLDSKSYSKFDSKSDSKLDSNCTVDTESKQDPKFETNIDSNIESNIDTSNNTNLTYNFIKNNKMSDEVYVATTKRFFNTLNYEVDRLANHPYFPINKKVKHIEALLAIELND